MNDKKERVYSEEDLCEYTILQKIDELEKQLKNIKNEFNGMYETKEAADTIHRLLRSNDAKINNRIDGLYNITPTDLIASANKLSLGVGNAPFGNGVNLSGFTYDEATNTLKASGDEGGVKLYRHSISFLKPNFNIYFDVYSTIHNSFTFPELYESIKNKVTCTGSIKDGDIQGQPVTIKYESTSREYIINYIDTNGSTHATSTNTGSVSLLDYVTPVN